MRFNIRNTLASIVVASAVGLSGCTDYGINQEGVDAMVEAPTKDWVEYTDNAMNVHQLVTEGKYEEAQSALENYLRQQARVGAEYNRSLKATYKVSKSAAERIGKTIDGQIQKIDEYLK